MAYWGHSLPQNLRILSVPRSLIRLIQRESRIPRYRELIVQRSIHQSLSSHQSQHLVPHDSSLHGLHAPSTVSLPLGIPADP